MTETQIVWKAAKCLELAPHLQAKGEIPFETPVEDAALDLMDWDDSRIDGLLEELGIRVPVPVPQSMGLTVPSLGAANDLAGWLEN